MIQQNARSLALGSLIVGIVGVITFGLGYLTKIGVEKLTAKEATLQELMRSDTIVKWGVVADWVGQMPPRRYENVQDIYPVLVHSAAEMAVLPVGTWVMTDEGIIGRVRTHAITMETYQKMDALVLVRWAAASSTERMPDNKP